MRFADTRAVVIGRVSGIVHATVIAGSTAQAQPAESAGRPEDSAVPSAYLAKRDTSFVTGPPTPVDGGIPVGRRHGRDDTMSSLFSRREAFAS